jgi:hypothetical protein
MAKITISPKKQEAIALEVIRMLYAELTEIPKNFTDNGHSPFHKAFLNVLKPKLDMEVNKPNFILSDSLLYDMNPSLWQTFFENVAHILSDGEKREFTDKKRKRLTITARQRDIVSAIMSDLKNSVRTPNQSEEDERLLATPNDGEEIDAQDFTADNFVETDEYIEAIELKSVRPNSGEMQGEKRKILTAKAALRKQYPLKNISFYFGFPFDPWSAVPTGHNKDLFLQKLIEGKKYLDPNEVLLASELWDKLSGQSNTMEQLLQIINSIASPDFLDRYEFLVDPTNIYSNREYYIQRLEAWGLWREKMIIENIDVLRSKPKNRSLERSLNNPLFNKGEYNLNRYETLISFL